MSTASPTPRRSFMRGGRVLWALVLLFAIAAGGAVAYVLLQASAQTTYYVLNTSVKARQQITPAMLSPIETKRGTAPAVAKDPADLNTATYAKYDISAGNLITSDNSGALVSLQTGIPSNFVVASFKVDPSAAAGGTLTRGDYIDIYAINPDTQESNLFLTRVLVLSAGQDLDSATTTTDDSASGSTDGSTGDSSTGSTSTDGAATTTTTVPFLFTVGLSPQNAALLATAQADDGNLYVTLASADQQNQIGGTEGAGAATNDIYGGTPVDAGVGTDSTFSTQPLSQAAATALPVQKAARDSVKLVQAYIKSNPTATSLAEVQAQLPNVSGVNVTLNGNPTLYTVSATGSGYTFAFSSATNSYTASVAANNQNQNQDTNQ